jgi:hypothetical protein
MTTEIKQDPCWKLQGNDMRAWAEDCDTLTPDNLGRHGLGPLDKPCDLEPGIPCLACGKVI